MSELTFKPLSKSAATVSDDLTIPMQVNQLKDITTIYVTPMPFAANLAAEKGVPIIGYHGLDDQYSENLSNLHPDFCSFLQKKKVHTVILLYNASVMHPDFKPGTEIELTKKFYNTYYAVKKFKETMSRFDPDITIIFAHIKHRFCEEGIESLDQLIEKYGEKASKSIQNFKAKTNEFIDSINVYERSINDLYLHLKLNTVTAFYAYHEQLLKNFEFTYKSVRWAFSGDRLEKIRHNDSKLYMRVGPDYYKRIMVVNSHDEIEEAITPWKKPEISLDYGVEFVKAIPKFDGFVNKPANNGEYQRTYTIDHNGVKSELYNMYNPIDWHPQLGEWPNIERFLRHIFSAANYDGEIMYDWGLDYLQLTYLNPRQRLPILALVSSERNTGKSTFLDLLKTIFGANCTILDNQRFSPQFTSHFAGKLIVAIDEGHIPVNDKLTKEMIKNMATGKVMWLEGKGSNAKNIDNFTHLIFCSNDEKNFMQIDAGENRFAVIKVPSYRQAGAKDDPDFLLKMKKEIPAFLNYLQNRQLHYSTKTTRFWFPDHVYMTEAFRAVVASTRNILEREFESWIRDCFFDYGQTELHFTLTDIVTRLRENTSLTSLAKTDLRDFLQNVYNVSPGPSTWYKLYSIAGDQVIFEKRKGRFCTFLAQNLLTNEEIEQISIVSEKCVPFVPKVPNSNILVENQ